MQGKANAKIYYGIDQSVCLCNYEAIPLYPHLAFARAQISGKIPLLLGLRFLVDYRNRKIGKHKLFIRFNNY